MGQKMDVRVKVGLCLTIFIVLLVPVKGVQSANHTVSILEERQLSCDSGLYGVWDSYLPDYGNPVLGQAPPFWDWRSVNGTDWTTSVKDQLQDVCGSCWAFGALGSLEAMVKIWNDDPTADVDLSEQYMLSCSSGGCDGWYWFNTLYWLKNNGAIPESCLPYEADDTVPCEAKCEDWRDSLVGIDGYKAVSSDVESIQNALVQYGPLPTTMDVYADFYPNYTGGVYRHTYGEYIWGHIVTIVGYDNTWGGDGEGYWIVKNSWGTAWGEDGWFRIAYGECDLEKGVHYYTGPNYLPERPARPSGETQGKPGEQYTYTAMTTDSDGDEIRYCFDWGDGNITWTTRVASGTMATLNYTWAEQGEYAVRVMAEDEHGLDSDWSDTLPVSMPLKHQTLLEIIIEWILQLFGIIIP